MALKRRNKSAKGRRLGKRLRKPCDDTETTRLYSSDDKQTLGIEGRNGGGVLRANTEHLNLPTNIDNIGDGPSLRGINWVVMVIVGAALTFISIITYFVAQMPKKD
jgi:hypothetical protein